MGLVTKGYFANMTVVDSGGNKATLRYALASATIADALTDAATLISTLNAVTDGVIVSYTVGEAYEEDSVFFAAAGVHVENVALISAKIDDPEIKYASLRIPAPADGIFLAASGPNYNRVDPADAGLVAYLNNFATAGIATISDGEVLESPGTAGNVTGKRIHRGSRMG